MFDEITVIEACFTFFFHRDVMNSAVHQAPVRYSPITFSVAHLLEFHYQSTKYAEIPPHVQHVLDAFVEDQ